LKRLLVFDIGAGSGRAIVGNLNDNKLALDEIYRFPNDGIKKVFSFFLSMPKPKYFKK